MGWRKGRLRAVIFLALLVVFLDAEEQGASFGRSVAHGVSLRDSRRYSGKCAHKHTPFLAGAAGAWESWTEGTGRLGKSMPCACSLPRLKGGGARGGGEGRPHRGRRGKGVGGGSAHNKRHPKAHSSIARAVQRDAVRLEREKLNRDWDEELYGPRKSIVEDESDISRLLMLRGSSFHDQLPELIVNGHIVAGTTRPPLPEDMVNLPIPMRPRWLRGVTDRAALMEAEHTTFREWRRRLALLEETYEVIMSPYEKNPFFWRQLWRVVERSDLVVQVLDARTPLVFYSQALHDYVLHHPPENAEGGGWGAAEAGEGICCDPGKERGVCDDAEWGAEGEAAEDADGAGDGIVADPGIAAADLTGEDPGGSRAGGDDRVPGGGLQQDEDESCGIVFEKQVRSPPGQRGAGGDCSGGRKRWTEQARKVHVVVCNKADLVPAHVRREWARYFRNAGWQGWQVVAAREESETNAWAQRSFFFFSSAADSLNNSGVEMGPSAPGTSESAEKDAELQGEWNQNDGRVGPSAVGEEEENGGDWRVLNAEALLAMLERLGRGQQGPGVEERVGVGLIGFPNVGKSSLVNALALGRTYCRGERDGKGGGGGSRVEVRVATAASPGKTKALQTILVQSAAGTAGVCLIDCPGLVLPSVVSSRDEMVCAGVLSIHTLRDVLGPIGLLCRTVPASVFEDVYGFSIQPSRPRETPRWASSARPTTELDRMRAARLKALQAAAIATPPTGSSLATAGSALAQASSANIAAVAVVCNAEDLLDAFCQHRRFLQQRSGRPDHHRAARVLLADYIRGRLPHWGLPPDDVS